MKYIDFERQLIPFKIFSIEDVRKKELRFDSRRLVEWQEKNYIQKIINRWYLFADLELSERYLFLMANKIYAPSYVSFESALAWHGLIPEGVFSVTSASSKKTKTFHTQQGVFIYHHLKPGLHFGYKLESIGNRFYKIAEREKAILDYLYLRPKIKTRKDFEAWRINTDELTRHLDYGKLEKYLTLFSNKALDKRIRSLLKYIDDVES